MTSRSEASVLDLSTSGFPPTCPSCDDIAFPGATVCESCGAHLFVRVGSGRQFKAPRQIVVGCTCGGNSICPACVVASYDSEPA